MARVWVLDTETKGTGARMVPLEDVLQEPDRGEAPPLPLPRKLVAPPEPAPPPRQPRSFRVVDAMTRQVLADDVDARAALEALRAVRALVDVGIYVREPSSAGWRPLTLAEKKVMWARRPADEGGAGRSEP